MVDAPVPKSQESSSPAIPAPRGDVSGNTSASWCSAACERKPPFHGLHAIRTALKSWPVGCGRRGGSAPGIFVACQPCKVIEHGEGPRSFWGEDVDVG